MTASAKPDAELVRDIRLHIVEGRSYVENGTDEDAFAVWIDGARDLADPAGLVPGGGSLDRW